MRTRRPIGPVDTMWLNMDRPNNLMIIDTLIFLDEPVDWSRLRAVVQERLVEPFPVFRQRPVPPPAPWAPPHWEDDPGFDLDRHVRRVRLQPPGDDEALRRYLESHLCRPLEHSRPLWEATVIDGYGAGAVLFSRFHHAISDGIALARVLLSLTDETVTDETLAGGDGGGGGGGGGGGAGRALAGTRRPDGGSGLLPGVAGALRRVPGVSGALQPVLGAAGVLSTWAASALPGAPASLPWLPRWAHPGLAGDVAVQALRGARAAHKLLVSRNPATSLGGEPGVAKTVLWTHPRPLDELKDAGRLAGATLNDVLMSALAGAIHTYLVDHDGAAADLSTMVPVNVRPLDRPLPAELGNQFALVLMKLPSGIGAPLARLAETKRRMDAIKHSPEAVLTYGLTAAMGRMARVSERMLADFFADKAIGVTTNVPGPRTTRYLAGSRITSVLAWVPSSGRQTTGVCIVTYDNTVRVGFKTDAATVPEPEKLVASFEEHLDAFTRMSRTA